MQTGRRAWQCELSTVDTAFLLAGASTAAAYFDAPSNVEQEIRRLPMRFIAESIGIGHKMGARPSSMVGIRKAALWIRLPLRWIAFHASTVAHLDRFSRIQDSYMRDKGINYFENTRRATHSPRRSPG
jgi:hypothetical protein